MRTFSSVDNFILKQVCGHLVRINEDFTFALSSCIIIVIELFMGEDEKCILMMKCR